MVVTYGWLLCMPCIRDTRVDCHFICSRAENGKHVTQYSSMFLRDLLTCVGYAVGLYLITCNLRRNYVLQDVKLTLHYSLQVTSLVHWKCGDPSFTLSLHVLWPVSWIQSHQLWFWIWLWPLLSIAYCHSVLICLCLCLYRLHVIMDI